MKEIEKTLKIFKKLHLVPEEGLAEALKTDLRDIAGIRIACLPKEHRTNFSTEIVSYTYIVREKNIVVLEVRNFRSNSVFNLRFHNFPNYAPHWELKYELGEPQKPLSDNLPDISFFLMNGRLELEEENSKYIRVGDNGRGKIADDQLLRELKHSVGPILAKKIEIPIHEITNFMNAIENTLLAEILGVQEKDFVEPKMKVGSGSDYRIVGLMTQFEKQCFTLLSAQYKKHLLISHRGVEKKIENLQKRAKKGYELSTSETANDQEIREAVLYLKTLEYLDDSISRMHREDSRDRLLALDGILGQTIKDRLRLNRGDNVRYYLGTGYQIVSETGIKEKKIKQMLDEAKGISQEDMENMLSINRKNNNDGEGDSNFTQNLCVLF